MIIVVGVCLRVCLLVCVHLAHHLFELLRLQLTASWVRLRNRFEFLVAYDSRRLKPSALIVVLNSRRHVNWRRAMDLFQALRRGAVRSSSLSFVCGP